MSPFFSQFHLKSIILIKIIGLALYFLFESDYLFVGEKEVTAQVDQETINQIEGENKKKDKAGEISRDDQINPNTSSSSAIDSMIGELFDLPKPNPDKVKKREIGKYLKLIERKNRQVEDKLDILRQQMEKLKNLEDSIDDKLTRLEEEVAYFQQTQQKEKQIKAERLDKLVEFYQKMEPKKAAPVFEQLDRDLVVALFNRIPQKQTTNILSLMIPERSVQLSEYYGRLRSANEYELLKEINTSLKKEFADCKTNL